MKPITVALLGVDGQLGQTIKMDWAQGDAATQFILHGFDLPELDITSAKDLDEKLSPLGVDVLINTAAYTAVDEAESNHEAALSINRDGARLVAQWAEKNQSKLIHLSTDFVFDGKSSSAYKPLDSTTPVNVYGTSKLAGEQAILEVHRQGSLIIRTSWLYSAYKTNFVKTMLKLMAEKDRLTVVVDQIGTPTSTHSLANLIAKASISDTRSGVFHWSDSGVASWFDFAVAIQEEALAVGLLDKEIALEPVSSDQYPTPAARPSFSLLDKSLSQTTFGCAPVHWRRQLRQVIEELANNSQEGSNRP